MPYSKSTARVDFDITANYLLKKARETERIPSSIMPQELKILVYQAVLVLLSSNVEEYHRHVIEDWFYQMRCQGALMDKVPLNTRMLGLLKSTEAGVKEYLYKKASEKNSIENFITNKSMLTKLLDDSEVFDIEYLHAKVWCDKKYPSQDNIKILYNRIGIPDIFERIHAKTHKNYKPLLKSFNDIRSSIAHTGSGSITYEDIKTQKNFICELIYILDKELYCHCCSISGSQYWPSH